MALPRTLLVFAKGPASTAQSSRWPCLFSLLDSVSQVHPEHLPPNPSSEGYRSLPPGQALSSPTAPRPGHSLRLTPPQGHWAAGLEFEPGASPSALPALLGPPPLHCVTRHHVQLSLCTRKMTTVKLKCSLDWGLWGCMAPLPQSAEEALSSRLQCSLPYVLPDLMPVPGPTSLLVLMLPTLTQGAEGP